jgi:hypothetical protein
VDLAGPGSLSVVETATTAQGIGSQHQTRTSVFARLRTLAKQAGSLKVRVRPGTTSLRLLHPGLVVRLRVTFTPRFGHARVLQAGRIRLHS